MANNKGKFSIIRKYNVSLCSSLISHCRLGKSRDSWILENMISPSLIDEWKNKYEDFNDSWILALFAQKEYWETKLLENNKSALRMIESINKQILLEQVKPEKPEPDKPEPEKPKESGFLSRVAGLDITKGN